MSDEPYQPGQLEEQQQEQSQKKRSSGAKGPCTQETKKTRTVQKRSCSSLLNRSSRALGVLQLA